MVVVLVVYLSLEWVADLVVVVVVVLVVVAVVTVLVVVVRSGISVISGS